VTAQSGPFPGDGSQLRYGRWICTGTPGIRNRWATQGDMFHKRSETSGARTIDLHGISLRALQVFAAVEETGSLTAAAARLGGTRSAVSQQITNLEKAIGTQLVDRASRPSTLTPAGKVVLRHAQRMLQVISETQTELMEISLSSMLELRFGVIDDLDASITPDLVIQLQERYPRCQLTVTSGRSDHLSEALAQRSLDLVLTGVLPEPAAAFRSTPILREPFVLAAPPGMFDPRGDLRAQMKERPFVRYNAGMPIGAMVAQHLRRLRIELPAPYSFDASRSVFAMMRRCGGWTLTTPLCVLDSGNDAEPLDCLQMPFPGFHRTIRIVTRPDELGSLPLHLAELCRKLIRQRLVPEVRHLAAWLGDEFTVLEAAVPEISEPDPFAGEAGGS
jgi:DNA-binding transcriptional LysR family regulator